MSPLETRELGYFVAVAENLHFGKAAEQLGITQPPLSRAISRLERRLGVPLLHRTTRQVSLTPAGSVFLAECRSILAAVDAAVVITQRAGTGRITVASRPASGPGVLPALLSAREANTDWPGIDVLFTHDEVGALLDGTADLALMCQTTTVPGIEFVELGPERPVAVLPAGHPLARRRSVTLDQVEALPGYTAQLPHEGLDTMVDRVSLGELVVVLGDSVCDRLGASVSTVPVNGFPATQLVLAWLPTIRADASHLAEMARSVLVLRERRRPPGRDDQGAAAHTGSRPRGAGPGLTSGR